MKNEFVKYEQALALKELGFDKPCLAFYSPKEELYPVFQEPSKGPYFNNGSFIETLRAPLYQQTFKWFREKYNIQGYIYSSTVRSNAEKTKQFTGYIWKIKGIDTPFLSTDARDELHDTYEKAESACLSKLIEITNEKIKNR